MIHHVHHVHLVLNTSNQILQFFLFQIILHICCGVATKIARRGIFIKTKIVQETRVEI